MGLDITAYSHLKPAGIHEKWADEDAHYEQHIEAFAYDCFPTSVSTPRGTRRPVPSGLIGPTTSVRGTPTGPARSSWPPPVASLTSTEESRDGHAS